MTVRDIAAEIKTPRSTVSDNLRRTRKLNSFYACKARSGRPKKLDARDRRRAVRGITSGQARDAAELQRTMFPEVSQRTMRRVLTQEGYPGRIRRKVQFLTKKHVSKRLERCRVWEEWEDVDWERVIFSDESKFNLFGSDGRQYCRRRPGEDLLPRNVTQKVAHGGGHVMVWGCITAQGTGRLHRVVGNLNAAGLTEIYDESLLGTLRDYGMSLDDVIFQEDNDRKHTSKLATAWRAENNVTRLDWPSSSPDLNPIENAWHVLDLRVRARNPLPRNADQMWTALQEEWARLDFSYIRRLYRSMPRRVEACIENKGRWIDY